MSHFEERRLIILLEIPFMKEEKYRDYSRKVVATKNLECFAVESNFVVNIQIAYHIMLSRFLCIWINDFVTTYECPLRNTAICSSWFADMDRVVFQVEIDVDSSY